MAKSITSKSRATSTLSGSTNPNEKETKMSAAQTVAPPQSAKPGSEVVDEKAKKEKVKRTLYPALNPLDDDGNPTGKLTAVPEDFDRRKHIPLRKGDFKDSAMYLDWRAAQCEVDAVKFRQQATEERALGNASDRAKAKRLKSLHDRFAQLQAELAGAGVDVDAILGIEEAKTA